MAQIIGLPKLSPTMEEGVLVRWMKKEGDKVEPGDLVAEVETDKANMDFNSEDEGTLLKLLVKEGDTVKLGAPVAIIGEPGEDISGLLGSAGMPASGVGPRASGAEPEPEGKTEAKPQPPQQPPPAKTQPPPAKTQPAPAKTQPPPAKTQPPPRSGPPLPAKRGEGRGGGQPDARSPKPEAPARLLASPLAKTLAIELGLDLRQITGTGPGGRIVERDVRAFAEQGGGGGATAEGGGGGAAEEQAPVAEVIESPDAQHDQPRALAVVRGTGGQTPMRIEPSAEWEDQPLSGVRRKIAERMAAAKRDVPHIYLTREIDATALLDFRKRLNLLLGDRGKVSVNDLIIKGTALALRRVPEVNAAFTGDAIRYFTRVHIGVAVATERGLITPVVRDADLKGIGVISADVNDLASRARDRSLKVHEIQGSTFTVTNLGMMGIDSFQAIINPPEAAILAIGTIRDTPVVRDGAIEAGKRMAMTLCCDHRVVDGAVGARYLAVLADLLEKPESLAL